MKAPPEITMRTNVGRQEQAERDRKENHALMLWLIVLGAIAAGFISAMVWMLEN